MVSAMEKGKRDLKGILSVGRAVLNTGVGSSSLRRTCSWWRSQLHRCQEVHQPAPRPKGRKERASVFKEQGCWGLEQVSLRNGRGRGPGAKSQRSCRPLWRLRFYSELKGEALPDLGRGATWSVIYVLEGTVWLPCWGQTVGGQGETRHHWGGYCSHSGERDEDA